ncbi:MAG: zinc ribbon domain-containing protein [Holdemanella sp.]|nr:zinc ribbon domain-containing protein [Holdemanella sp.]
MKCKNCNTMNVPNATFCQKCGMPLYTPQKDRTPDILCLISVVLMLAGAPIRKLLLELNRNNLAYIGPFYRILYSIFEILPLVAIVLMVIARVKYPENRFAKILMWVYIIGFVVMLLVLAITILSCGFALRDCSNYYY